MTAPKPERTRTEQFITQRQRAVTAQLAGAATTLEDLYTVPPGYLAKGVLNAVNRSTATTIRVAIRPLGAAINNKHYVSYDAALAAGEDIDSIELTLEATDVLSVYAGTNTVSWTFEGTEEPKT